MNPITLHLGDTNFFDPDKSLLSLQNKLQLRKSTIILIVILPRMLQRKIVKIIYQILPSAIEHLQHHRIRYKYALGALNRKPLLMSKDNKSNKKQFIYICENSL